MLSTSWPTGDAILHARAYRKDRRRRPQPRGADGRVIPKVDRARARVAGQTMATLTGGAYTVNPAVPGSRWRLSVEMSHAVCEACGGPLVTSRPPVGGNCASCADSATLQAPRTMTGASPVAQSASVRSGPFVRPVVDMGKSDVRPIIAPGPKSPAVRSMARLQSIAAGVYRR